MLKTMAMISALLLLPACSVLEGVGLAGDASGIFGDIAEKGKEVEAEAFRKFANGFDGYCKKTPTAIRDWARENVNANTEEFLLPDICVPKPQVSVE